jgi:2-oxoisovalerate dehydrogenase E1 component
VGLLRTALRGDDPTSFFEHRALLDTPTAGGPTPATITACPLAGPPPLEGDELTVVTWGAMVERCLEAAARPFPGG